MGIRWVRRCLLNFFGIVLSVQKIFMLLWHDPRLFNFLIMGLYGLSALRWAYEGKIADTCYWLSALAITLTITFLYQH